MQEGLAYVCLLTSNMTLTRAKIDTAIPRKQSGSSSQHDKAVLRFFDQIIEAIIRHVQFNGLASLSRQCAFSTVFFFFKKMTHHY